MDVAKMVVSERETRGVCSLSLLCNITIVRLVINTAFVLQNLPSSNSEGIWALL